MDTMMCGGIEKSALSLLSSLNPDLFDITLCLDKMKGEFLPFVPQWVTIIAVEYDETDYLERKLGAKGLFLDLIRRGKLFSLLKRAGIILYEKMMSKDKERIHKAHRFYRKSKPTENMYDLAVAYSNMEQFVYVNSYINSKRKLGWFHTQIDTAREDLKQYSSILKQFDTLFCVSKNLVESTSHYLPEIKQKLKFFPHIINTKMMLAWAEKESASWSPDNTFHILSIGRLSYEKGFDLIPKIAYQLKKDKLPFEWIILGEGSERIKIKNMIDSLDLSEHVILGGLSLNPYPYFKTCDVYIQPSRIEGFGITIAEAKVFAKPIISTSTDGAKDQIEHGINGVLVDNNENAIYISLKNLMLNEKLRQSYSDNLSSQPMDNNEGVNLVLHEIEMIHK